MDVHGRFSLRCNGSIDAIGAKCNFRIAVALQHFAVHFPVTHSAAAVAAPGVHHDFTRELARRRIKTERTSLQAEGSMNRVQRIAKRVIDSRALRVELKCEILRGSRDAGREKRNRPQELQARSALVRWGV